MTSGQAGSQRHLRVVRGDGDAHRRRARTAGALSSEWYRPSHGVDFAFLSVHDGRPVSWSDDDPVVVRLAGPGPDDALAYLRTVVAEVAHHTGLDLVLADPDPSLSGARVDETVPGEILVSHQRLDVASRAPGEDRPRPTVLGTGTAVLAGDGRSYTAGRAVLYPERIGDDRQRYLGVLRHEFGHAVGLGHAARAGTVMCAHTTVSEWQIGDLAGLERLAGHHPVGGDPVAVPRFRPSLVCGAADEPSAPPQEERRP